MSAFTLETAGLDFKRIPLPAHTIIQPNKQIQPVIKSGFGRDLLHVTKETTFQTSFDKSLGFYYENYVMTHKNTSLDIHIEKDLTEPIWLKFIQNEIIEQNTIVIEPYCKAVVIMSYEGDEMIHHGDTRIQVKEGAELTLVKIQANGMNSQFVDQTLIEVEDRGQIKVLDFQLGSEHMIINYDANLLGYQASGDFKSIYLASDKRGIDTSFRANHIGRRSTSNILGKGVLSGHAKKVFRGTLNFEEGSTQSVGKEEEVVLLLSDNVKSDSIPALMCAEDDVIGEHGASIGQVDEDQLFYLMSRGLSEHQAKLLVISSSFAEIVEAIPDQAARQLVESLIDGGIEHVI